MRFLASRTTLLAAFAAIAAAPLAGKSTSAQAASAQAARQACPNDDTGLTLSPGFCATVFADGIGHARHMVAAPNGVLYVNTWSGEYYGNDTPPAGGFLVALQDKTGSGKADVIERFGETVANGVKGGTGIGMYRGALYAEIDDRIVRYSLSSGSIAPKGPPETIVSGLPLGGDHPMHPFVIDADGALYVDVASASNACQLQNRQPKSTGAEPCVELETRGGVWRYDANKTNQTFSTAERFATGIRNASSFAIDGSGRVFTTQHGRDQVYTNWPDLYEPDDEATLPAEELMLLKPGADFGWPHCYYDPFLQKRVLAPEYGGDGGKAVGVCAEQVPSGGCISSSLGAERAGALRPGTLPGPLPRRSLHRVSRLVESSTFPTARLQRGLSAARWRSGLRTVRDLRRWFRGSGEIAGQSRASPDRSRRRTRWFALRFG